MKNRNTFELVNYSLDEKDFEFVTIPKKSNNDSVIDRDLANFARNAALAHYTKETWDSKKIALANRRMPSNEDIQNNPDLAILNFISSSHDSDKNGLIGLFYQYMYGECNSNNDSREALDKLRATLETTVLTSETILKIPLNGKKIKPPCVYLDLTKLNAERLARILVEVIFRTSKLAKKVNEGDADYLQHLTSVDITLTDRSSKLYLQTFLDIWKKNPGVIGAVLSSLFGIYFKTDAEVVFCNELLLKKLCLQDFNNPDSDVNIMSRKHWDLMCQEISTQKGACLTQLKIIQDRLNALNSKDAVWLQLNDDTLIHHMEHLAALIKNDRLTHLLDVLTLPYAKEMRLGERSLEQCLTFSPQEYSSFLMAIYNNNFEVLFKQFKPELFSKLSKVINSRDIVKEMSHAIFCDDILYACLLTLKKELHEGDLHYFIVGQLVVGNYYQKDEAFVQLFSSFRLRSLYFNEAERLSFLMENLADVSYRINYCKRIDLLISCNFPHMESAVRDCVNPYFINNIARLNDSAHTIYNLLDCLKLEELESLYTQLHSVTYSDPEQNQNRQLACDAIKSLIIKKTMFTQYASKWGLFSCVTELPPEIKNQIKHAMHSVIEKEVTTELEAKTELYKQKLHP